MPNQAHIDVIAFSDMHAHWQEGIRHALAAVQHTNPDSTLVIDNGDLLTGSLLGAYLASGEAAWETSEEPHPLLAALERAGGAAWVPGNHDIDYGAAFLRRAVRGLTSLQPVCANLTDPTGELLFLPSVVVERAGTRLGVVGAITGHAQRLTRYEAARELICSPPLEAVRAEVARLTGSVDAIVVAYHGGFAVDPDTGMPMHYPTGEDEAHQLLQIPGVDAVIAGHQHWRRAGISRNERGPVAYVQPGYAGRVAGRIRFSKTADSAPLSVMSAQLLETVDSAREGFLAPDLAAAASEAQEWNTRERSNITVEWLHRLLDQRLAPPGHAPHTVLAVQYEPRSLADIGKIFPGVYGASKLRMPVSEYDAAVARAGEAGFTVSASFTDDDLTGADVEIVANAPFVRLVAPGRVVEDFVVDWHDEATYRLRQL